MSYSFRWWKLNLKLWLATTELQNHAIGPAIVLRLDGAPRQLGEEMMSAETDCGTGHHMESMLTHGQLRVDGTGHTVPVPGWMILQKVYEALRVQVPERT